MGLLEKIGFGKSKKLTTIDILEPTTRKSGQFLTGEKVKEIAKNTVAVSTATAIGVAGGLANAKDLNKQLASDRKSDPPTKELHQNKPDDAVSHFRKKGLISGKVSETVDQAIQKTAAEQRKQMTTEAEKNAQSLSESFGQSTETIPELGTPPAGYKYEKETNSFILKTGRDYEKEGKAVKYSPSRVKIKDRKKIPVINPDKKKHKPELEKQTSTILDQSKNPPYDVITSNDRLEVGGNIHWERIDTKKGSAPKTNDEHTNDLEKKNQNTNKTDNKQPSKEVPEKSLKDITLGYTDNTPLSEINNDTDLNKQQTTPPETKRTKEKLQKPTLPESDEPNKPEKETKPPHKKQKGNIGPTYIVEKEAPAKSTEKENAEREKITATEIKNFLAEAETVTQAIKEQPELLAQIPKGIQRGLKIATLLTNIALMGIGTSASTAQAQPRGLNNGKLKLGNSYAKKYYNPNNPEMSLKRTPSGKILLNKKDLNSSGSPISKINKINSQQIHFSTPQTAPAKHTPDAWQVDEFGDKIYTGPSHTEQTFNKSGYNGDMDFGGISSDR